MNIFNFISWKSYLSRLIRTKIIILGVFFKQGFKQSNVHLYLQNEERQTNYTNAELINAIKEAKNYNSMTNAAKSTTSGCAY